MRKATAALSVFALAGVAFGQVSPGSFTPDAVDDMESYSGTRTPIPALFGGDVPVVTGAVSLYSVSQGDWLDFRGSPALPIQATSGTKFGALFGFGDCTLDFRGLGGITGFSGWASAAGVGDDSIEFFDLDGNPLGAPVIVSGGFGPGDGTMVEFSFVSTELIGSVRLSGSETCYDDLAYGFGEASENALVLDYGSQNGIGAAATDAAGLFPLVTTTPGDFVAALPTTAWRMVTIDNPANSFDTATSDAIAAYVDGGGRVHMTYWNLDADPVLQEAFGVASATDFFDPRPVFAVGGHESWGGLTEVAVGPNPSPWADNGDTLATATECGAGGPRIVGEFDSAGSGEGAIVTTGQTLVNGFDYDSMDLAAVERLVTNQIRWLRSSGPTDPQGPSGCIADCTKDGQLDFFDFLCFQNNFAAGSCEADCDFNGELDFFDFLCFQNEFATGCPDLTLVEYGTEAPPATDCGLSLTKFPVDGRPDFTLVTDVPAPIGGQLTFDINMDKRTIPGSWGSWSHGYNGSLYYTAGMAQVNVGVPANGAFYLYVEPNPFALIEFEITGESDGTEVSTISSIEGLSGAKGFGFCGGVDNVNVRTTDGFTDFAIGEFGIAN